MGLNRKYDIDLITQRLIEHLINEDYKGYDPYDTLNSFLPFKYFGSFAQAAAIQIQLRNPVNIRPLLGIKKEKGAKSLGLILHAYSVLYSFEPSEFLLKQMHLVFDMIKNMIRKDDRFSGYFWAVHYPLVLSGRSRSKFDPSSVLACFMFEGIFEFYRVTQDEDAKEVLLGISKFITSCIPTTVTDEGKCYSYTALRKDIIYNANSFVSEILAKCFYLTGDEKFKVESLQTIKFNMAHMRDDGSWSYRFYPETGKDKNQIDFHQGFILNSINEALKYLNHSDRDIELKLEKAYSFYMNEQFTEDGKGLWRYPELFPIDIHNQAVGIIVFSRMFFDPEKSKERAKTILKYTLNNLYSEKKGIFYYQKRKLFTNKIDYFRWNQAWMLLALAYFKKMIK